MPDFEQLVSTTHLGHQAIATRLCFAVVLGGILGFDREMRRRAAGMRTHMLVAMASALFTVLAIEIVHALPPGDDAVGDPVRIIEAVTAGVAFLAAGTIIHARGKVEGVTTGAGLWLAGAVGLTCGLGHWLIALIAVALGVFVLVVLDLAMRGLGTKALEPDEAASTAPGRE